MALIQCPECKKQISSFAVACPSCGYPVSSGLSNKAPSIQLRNCPDCVEGRVQVYCGSCDGSGQKVCSSWSGDGRYWDTYDERYVICTICHGHPRHPCEWCAGRGYDLEECETCDGAGQLTFEEFEKVKRKKQVAEQKREEQKKRQETEARKQEEKRKQEQEEAKRKWEAEAPLRAAAEQQRLAEEQQRLAEKI